MKNTLRLSVPNLLSLVSQQRILKEVYKVWGMDKFVVRTVLPVLMYEEVHAVPLLVLSRLCLIIWAVYKILWSVSASLSNAGPKINNNKAGKKHKISGKDNNTPSFCAFSSIKIIASLRISCANI